MTENHDCEEYAFLVQSNDPSMLSLLTSVLESADIPFQVQGAETTGLLPFATGTPGLVARGLASRISVPLSRLEEARALLAADFSDQQDAEDTQE